MTLPTPRVVDRDELGAVAAAGDYDATWLYLWEVYPTTDGGEPDSDLLWIDRGNWQLPVLWLVRKRGPSTTVYFDRDTMANTEVQMRSAVMVPTFSKHDCPTCSRVITHDEDKRYTVSWLAPDGLLRLMVGTKKSESPFLTSLAMFGRRGIEKSGSDLLVTRDPKKVLLQTNLKSLSETYFQDGGRNWPAWTVAPDGSMKRLSRTTD